MIENRPIADFFTHFLLIAGIAIIAFPLYLTFLASTYDTSTIITGQLPLWPGTQIFSNYAKALFEGATQSGTPVHLLLTNSLIMALGIALGKIAISILSAFAVVYFRFPLRMLVFWLIFITLMLPVEVRILPTYKVIADLNLLNSQTGLILPLIASATATLLFRQFFLTVPVELAEAAKIDGAGPLRFLKDHLIPLARTTIAALFVIQFIYGWNQYLWPLLITTDPEKGTVVIAIKRMIGGADALTEWGVVMATAMLTLLPPVMVVLLMQRWFVKGLVDTEK